MKRTNLYYALSVNTLSKSISIARINMILNDEKIALGAYPYFPSKIPQECSPQIYFT